MQSGRKEAHLGKGKNGDEDIEEDDVKAEAEKEIKNEVEEKKGVKEKIVGM